MAGGTWPKVTVELGYLSYLFIFVPLRKNSQGVAVHLLLGAKSWWELWQAHCPPHTLPSPWLWRPHLSSSQHLSLLHHCLLIFWLEVEWASAVSPSSLDLQRPPQTLGRWSKFLRALKPVPSSNLPQPRCAPFCPITPCSCPRLLDLLDAVGMQGAGVVTQFPLFGTPSQPDAPLTLCICPHQPFP